MARLTKRVVDAVDPSADQDKFLWDGELRGFGLRVKPSGLKTYMIQYRNGEGRSRRLVIGQHGVLTPEQARGIARQKLAAVARGDDPSAERHAARAGMTIAEVCDWYLENARSGRILGRHRRPIKAATLDNDQSRINTHIKPLLGAHAVRSIGLADIEGMQAHIAAGRKGKKRSGRGGQVSGGAGVASRAVGTLRSILGHARRWGLIKENPAIGVRLLASRVQQRRLSCEELEILGRALRNCAQEHEHPTGLAAIRLMLLTGFRRLEALGLKREWVHGSERCVRFPDTKNGPQVRAIGRAALEVVAAQPRSELSPYVFPADWGDGHFIGVVRVLDRVCAQAKLGGVTPHVLRHTFASIAAELGYSELTIAGLLGHSARGVTQRYVHLDTALAVAADQVSQRIAELLDDPAPPISAADGAEHWVALVAAE